MKVRVYRNLHRKCYSIQTYIKGKGWRVTDQLDWREDAPEGIIKTSVAGCFI